MNTALCLGGVLVLYTDRVVEAESPTGEEYAAARLATVELAPARER
jgi:serine phosphatase RsbU (regulator of sigma subunit)